VFVATRLAIWGAAALAFAWFPRHGGGPGVELWVRSDSSWYLGIAHHGYGADPQHAPAFFPLYPVLVAGLGRVLGDYPLAGLLISLAATAVAFELLWRLAAPRIGAGGATRAVLYLALFPMAVFLGAVYTESLFLALAVAAFLLAERDHWVWASVAAGAAMLTRSVGIAILAGLLVLAWPEARRLGWLLLAPLMFASFPLALHFQTHDALAFVHAQDDWDRVFSPAGPFGGLWDGIAALWGTTDNFSHRYYLAVNIENLLYLAPFLALLPLVWRRVGKAYAVYAALALAIPMSFPASNGDFPLFSMPRFTILAFPCFIALALVGERSWAHTTIVAASALLLGVAIVQWTLGALA
jgi:hypothetical protein